MSNQELLAWAATKSCSARRRGDSYSHEPCEENQQVINRIQELIDASV